MTRTSGATGPAPDLDRRPEIVQGLRNLVQNAVDFAGSTVWIDLDWTETALTVAIGDDGPGYPSELIGRIGDPFVRRRAGAPCARPGYQGMGLGLFIAKTLLERSGARLRFANATAAADGPSGAVAEVSWPRRRLAGGRDRAGGPRPLD